MVERLRHREILLDSSSRLHLFRLAIARGIACLGPDVGSQTCLVGARDWLGEPPPHQRDAALNELARRYPEDTLINSMWIPAIRAAMELQRGNATSTPPEKSENGRRTSPPSRSE